MSTNKKSTRTELANVLLDEGYILKTNYTHPGVSRFKNGKPYSIMLSMQRGDHTLVIPGRIDTIGELRYARSLLEEMLDADSYKSAQDESNKEIDYNTVILGNKLSFLEGSFFPFDEDNTLTKHLPNLITVIKHHKCIQRDLGVLKDKKVIRVNNSIGKLNQYSPDNINIVANWFEEYNISFRTNIDDDKEKFEFKYKGILVESHREHYFVLVGDGSDDDMVKKYLKTKEIHKYCQSNRPKVNGNYVNIDNIVIATPFSRQGKLYEDDKLEIKEEGVTHQDSIDFMPMKEYAKSFQYSRLPFSLIDRSKPIPCVSMLVSDLLRNSVDRPLLLKQYINEKNAPGHKREILGRKGFY